MACSAPRAPAGGSRIACSPVWTYVFLASAQTFCESGPLAASLTPRVRTRSEAVNGNHRLVFGRGLEDDAVIMGLHEFAPVRRRVVDRCDGRRLERFAEAREDLPDRPWFADRRSVATEIAKSVSVGAQNRPVIRDRSHALSRSVVTYRASSGIAAEGGLLLLWALNT